MHAMRSETKAIVERYKRRTRTYDPLDPAVNRSRQEFERALIRLLKRSDLTGPDQLELLEIGCGSGGNLLQFLRLGFQAKNLVGNELQESLAQEARHRLPDSTRVFSGDALDLDLPEQSFDIVLQSLVFSSILDEQFRRELAGKIWTLVRPGGGILWYDFAYDNPSNPDVKGIPKDTVSTYFPEASLVCWRITLAPPISRAVTKVHPGLYAWFNCLPLLRTHWLCWLKKRA